MKGSRGYASADRRLLRLSAISVVIGAICSLGAAMVLVPVADAGEGRETDWLRRSSSV